MKKGVQVCVKFGKILKRNSFSQTDLSCFENKDAETQCGVETQCGHNNKLVHERGIDST